MKTNFTKGAWKAVAQMPEGYSIETKTGQVIAMSQCDEEYNATDPITKDEEYANAKLIAAAPELLKAAQLCQTISDRCNNAMLPKHIQELLQSINDTLTESINNAIN